MGWPSKTSVARFVFVALTPAIVFAGTSLFLGEVLHMEWGPLRAAQINMITILWWSSIRMWLRRRSKNDSRS